MWTLRVLGALELATPSGLPFAAVSAQPKRIALLTYLALARPGGAHTRDHLLGLLWPELDERHARAALRQAIHHLRLALGERAIVASGYDELRLEPESIVCDALRFETELDADRPESALTLYRGELLDGFFVSGAPAFEDWLERERGRLRARAANGAWALAERAGHAGNVDEAERWGARALALSHDDEMMLQRFLRLLEQLGDRVRAVLEYDGFARRMRREYEMEPSTETRHLVDSIRTRISGSFPARQPSNVVAQGRAEQAAALQVDPVAVHVTVPTTRSIARSDNPKSRRMILGVGAALLAAAIVIAGLARHRLSAAVPLDTNLLVVAPFEAIGPPDSLLRQRKLADLFAAELDDAGSLRTVPTDRVFGAWNGPTGADRASALSLARRLRAGLVLFGTITRAGPDSNGVKATLVDAATGSVISEQKRTGAESHLDQLVDSIALALVLDLSARVGIARPAGSLGSQSLPAIKAFLRGDQEFRRAQWDSAEWYYQHAVDGDSTFALAYRQLGRLAVWRGSEIGVGLPAAHFAGLALSQRASRFAHGLGERDSLLIVSDSLVGALAPDLCEDAAARQRLFDATRTLTARFPRDAEGWVARGDALFVCGGYVAVNEPGISKREMLQAFDSAVVLDPSLGLAYHGAFRLALDLGDTGRVLRYADRYLTLHPSEASASYVRVLSAVLRRPKQAEAILDLATPHDAFAMFASLLLYADSTELAVAAARRLRSTTAAGGTWDIFPGVEGPIPAASFRPRPFALAEAYRGHLRNAAALAGTDRSPFAGRLAADLPLAEVWAGVSPDVSIDSAFSVWLRTRPFTFDEAIASALAWWGERHDTLALREYLRRSRSPQPRDLANVRIARYAHHREVARAYLALALGDSATATALFESLPSNEWWINERLVLARLRGAGGRPREALAVLDRGIPYPYATPLCGIWAMEHARLAAQVGEQAKARESFEYVTRLWRAADGELQVYVREARAALPRRVRAAN
jgi:serine/threonine-protein kinase